MLVEQFAQFFQHLFVSKFLAPREDDFPRPPEQFRFDHALKCVVSPNPFIGWIVDVLLFQFARRPVIDVVADVFFVGEDLMHRAPVPFPPEVGFHALRVEAGGNLGFDFPATDEHLEDPLDDFDLVFRPAHQHDAVSLDAFVFPHLEQCFALAALVNQHPPQAESGRPALLVAELNQPARALEYLGRKLAAVFARHRPLHGFHDRGHWAAVIFELFGAVVDRDTHPPADIFVVRAFVGILESAPAADIVNEDVGELRATFLDIADHLRERVATLDVQTAFPLVGVFLHDGQSTALRVFADDIHLVARRILLMFRGHAHIHGGVVQPAFGVLAAHAARFLICFMASLRLPAKKLESICP